VITVPVVEVYAAARVYLLAIHHDELQPTIAVQQTLNLTRGKAGQRLRAARDLGLLPEAGRGIRVLGPGHWPRAAQWCSDRGRPIWTACQECHHPWPCAEAATLVWLKRLERAERAEQEMP
jgi:hypothetical protein